jgi:hypothetical protein
MSTGDDGARDGHAQRDDHDRRGERISIGGGDDSVTRIQLAARWAESYAPEVDSLGNVLRRFRAAYDYLDAVIHGVEPPELDREAADTRAAQPPPLPPAAPVPASEPQPQQPEQRPWP